MGVRLPTAFINNSVSNLPNTAEGVICTTSLLTLPIDGATVFLFGYFTLVPGTTATAVTPRIRRGASISGTQIAPASGVVGGSPIVVAGNQINITLMAVDSNPGAGGNLQYVLTGQQTGGTAAGVINDGVLIALVL